MSITNPLFADRESWLTEAANLILDDLITPKVASATMYSYERPVFRISVGFPKHSRGGKAIAVCFKREASTDGVNEIFINPELDDPIAVMEAMVHELVHAYDDCASGHQHFFAHIARKVGLEGPLTATHCGDRLKATLKAYAEMLGVFPHRKMQLDLTHKKDSTRQLKVSCDNQSCGFLFRTSQLQLHKLFRPELETPFCPACDTGKLRIG
jgi:hypothetical protein